MLRVVIADNHALWVEGVRAALDADPGISVCATAADAPSAVHAVLEHRPDVCLLDIQMPGNGLAAAWEITARLPDVSLIVLTVSDAEADLFAALHAGAAGYLLKTSTPRGCRAPFGALCAARRRCRVRSWRE